MTDNTWLCQPVQSQTGNKAPCFYFEAASESEAKEKAINGTALSQSLLWELRLFKKINGKKKHITSIIHDGFFKNRRNWCNAK